MPAMDPIVISVTWSVAGLALLFTIFGRCTQSCTHNLVTKYETMCFCGKTAVVASIVLGVVVTIPASARVLVPLLSTWVLAITSLVTIAVGVVSVIIGRKFFDKQPLWVYEACCHFLAPVATCLLADSLFINLIQAIVSLVR